jgi:hypothetical protein
MIPRYDTPGAIAVEPRSGGGIRATRRGVVGGGSRERQAFVGFYRKSTTEAQRRGEQQKHPRHSAARFDDISAPPRLCGQNKRAFQQSSGASTPPRLPRARRQTQAFQRHRDRGDFKTTAPGMNLGWERTPRSACPSASDPPTRVRAAGSPPIRSNQSDAMHRAPGLCRH